MSTETATTARVSSCIPMFGVADVQRSIDFYEKLGFEAQGTHRDPKGGLVWAHLRAGDSDIMINLREKVEVHSACLYTYSRDLPALRQRLLQLGISVSEISYPFFMKKGECELQDPDGYTIFIGQI